MASKTKKLVKKIKVLVTAGPTREYLDPVRYLSNDSSGRMGFALARAAAHLDCKTTLVTGPVDLNTPHDVKRIDVTSAREMHEAVMKHAKAADVIIMAAAVSDFRPAKTSKGKIKKTAKNANGITLKLARNTDILAEICKKRRDHQTIVGFALETENLERNAQRKLKQKDCDWIIANSPKAITSEISGGTLIGKDKKKIHLPRMPKEDLAVVILSHIL
jgi:phosphopantothenoylcysteine decarboxylase / phosphopantothenate---cysteine ligase